LSLRALGTARATITGTPLSAKGVERLNAFWRARDYLALGIYLPPDTSCLLSVANHCLRSESYVIVSDKQLHLQYLDIDAAIAHCTKGIGIWAWASNDLGQEPGVVVACAGDIPDAGSLGGDRPAVQRIS
jgi:phosphoketolase